MRHHTRTGAISALIVASIALAGCSSGSGDATGGAGKDGDFVIGVSNTLAGNGWREEMICAVKAEALASGDVSKVIAISKNGGPSDQIQDMQNLISQGADAIIVNPSDREKLNPIIKEAENQGIVVVAVDSPVTEPSAYIAVNDQEAWGYLSAKWLFDKIGGKGNILYMRGIEGVPADTDRDTGFQKALADYPDITYKQVFTGWDYTKAGEIAVQELSAAPYDAVWTSGMDYTIVNAFATANVDPVPVTGMETNAFIKQLIDGQEGAVTTNPAIIGGVGANIALKVLNGETVERETILTPEVLDTAATADRLDSSYLPDANDQYSSTLSIDGWTTFTPEQLVACKGPGE